MTNFFSFLTGAPARARRPLLAGLWLALLPLLALAGTPVLRLETTVTPGTGVDATAFVDQIEIIDAVTGVVVANAVPNASFETSGALNNFTYGYNPGGAGWTFAGTSGIANNGSAFGAPITPYGTRVALLQTGSAGSSFSQTLPSLPAGYYQVRAQVARRAASNASQGIRFLMDGVVVGITVPSSTTAYDTYLSPAFAIDAVLQLEGLGSNSQAPTADVTAFVDQVELLNMSTGGTSVPLTNPSFENAGSLTGFNYGYAPTGTGWDFTSNAGLATNGSAFGNPNAPNGTVVALLQYTSAVSQVIPVLPVASYRVRLFSAQRIRLSSDQVVRVLLNGQELGRFLPPASFTQYTLPSTSTSFALTVPVPPAPVLTALSPFIGGPGTVLTLTGTNLAGTSSISFFGAAGVKTVTTGFTVNAAGTQITGVVVPDDVLSGPVRATTAGGNSAVGTALFSRATTLSAGTYHTAAVRADGTLWTWGANNNGQLGLGDNTNRTTPVQVGTATTWASVAAGTDHTLAVRADGTLWAWGNNSNGQLGLGDTNGRATPVQVGTATNWTSVSGGAYHSVAGRADGTLWAWGWNLFGQLGLGDQNSRNAPVQVPGSTSWASVSAGEGHTAAVRADGTLWAWGYNSDSQLGLGDNTRRNTPVQVPGSTSWVSVSAGVFYTAALRADGTLWTWGSNSSGQLGLGDTNGRGTPVQVPGSTSWTSASAGGQTAALQADGTLWAWGYNGSGQLGLGDNTDRTTPVRVGMATSWLSAEAGNGHTAGEQTCRAVWAWGYNANGQVGDGTTTSRNSPVLVFNGVSLASFSPASAPAGTTVAVTGTGLAGLSTFTVNGANALSSVSNNTDTGFSFVVPAGAAIGAGSVAVAASCGTASSAAFTVVLPPTLTAVSPLIGKPGTVLTLTGTSLTGTSSISFFGAAGVKTVTTGFTVNAAGTQITGVVVPAGAQSGPVTATTAGGTSPAGTALFSRATTLGAGGLHSAQVRSDGSLWAWGYNNEGQIGLGTVNTFAYLAPVRSGSATNWASVSAGQYFTVALRTDGTLWSWGRNASGQLGRPSTAADQGQPVQVGSATNWVSVSAGADHVVAVRADGTLWAWGDNTYGQLGLGDVSNRAAPVQVPGASNWVSASAGGFHTVAVRADGTAWAWGRNLYGQLGQNNQVQQTSPVLVSGGTTTWVSISAGYQHTVAVQANGTLWSWGANYVNQLGQGNTNNVGYPLQVGALTSWASLDAGDVHNLAVRADGTLWAWGDNTYGQLGVGDATARAIPTQVPGTLWATAAGGNTHTLAEQSCQAIWGWGQSNAGQVGDGTQNNRFSPVQIINPVSLLSFTPASAPAGATVAVTGTSLASLTTLTVNGANALASVTNNTATGFSFVVPAGATATGTTTVAAGCGAASSAAFTVLLPPTLTALSAAAELPGQAVLLTGTGFSSGSTVSFGGVAAASVTYTSPTSLTAVVPVGATPGNSPVVVTAAGGTSASSPAFEVLQVYRTTTASGCLSTAPLTLSGSGGAGAWRYLRLPGAGGAVVAAIEDTRNLGTVTAGVQALGTATSTAVRRDGGANRRYLDRNFFLTATNPSFTGQTVRVRFFGLSSELARLTAADPNATAATLKASQYDGANQNCTLADNDPNGERRLLAAPATVLAGADWFTAQVSVADHFSEFYLTGASTPLPVELTTFTATAEGAAVALAWRTASEKNSARFDIERSADGRTFEKIGEQQAQGNKASPTDYRFLDGKLPILSSPHPLYYRLRQVDLDGTASYSPVRAVTVGGKADFTLYPNPAHAAVTAAGLPAGAPVLVFDALGRPVARATADASGTARLTLPAGLAAGVYIVKSGTQAQRLTVE